MVELVDTPDLGSGGESRGVQVPSPAPNGKIQADIYLINAAIGVSLKS